jgi:heme exporter protein A
MNTFQWFTEPAASDLCLVAEEVCKAYHGVPVLYPTSFSLSSGEVLVLFGPNGSGKTTLLRLAAGLERPSAGSVTLTSQLGRTRIGFAGHESYLYDDLTGLENLSFFLDISGIRRTAMEIALAVEAVGMHVAGGKRVRNYSAGMKRRINLARLLLTEPDVLLLDEPHAALDDFGQALVDEIVTTARDSGRIIAIASHDQDRSLVLSDRVMALESGQTVFAGTSGEWAKLGNLRVLASDSR